VINITNQVRISLSSVFAIAIVVSLLFADKLGKAAVTCFSLGFFCLFCGATIVPILFTRTEKLVEQKYYQISPLLPLVRDEKAKAYRAYDSVARVLIRIGLAFLLLGIIVFAVVY
jgi:hypothetical protein